MNVYLGISYDNQVGGAINDFILVSSLSKRAIVASRGRRRWGIDEF